MATRFPVLLAHAGCDHTGSVVWEQRDRGHAGGEGGPVLVGLPRGFVSLNAGDGSIEIVCAGCRQTVASAARGEPLGIGAAADPTVGPTVAKGVATAVADPVTRDETASRAEPVPYARDAAAGTQAAADHVDRALQRILADTAAQAAPGDAPGDATEANLPADIEALFAEAEDVAPIRGDKIPAHLLDRLRHLADRMRQRRE
jgi:hypothetical protein